MDFVAIVSLAVLLIAGLAGLAQGVGLLAGRLAPEVGMPRPLGIALYLAGGLAALVVAALWLFSL